MHTVLVLLIGFLTFVQPRSVSAFFTAGQAAAEFSWQIGHWLLVQPEVVVQTSSTTEVLTETISNPQFREQLTGWEISGAVVVEQASLCDTKTQPVVRIGTLPTEYQRLQSENELKQTFAPINAEWLAIRYCIISWETLPLFDEPGLRITLSDKIVWEDAPSISERNQDEPFVSGWRTATVPIPAGHGLLDLVVSAGNTIDPTNATLVYIASISTAGLTLPAGASVVVTPALAASTVSLQVNLDIPLTVDVTTAQKTIELSESHFSSGFGVQRLEVLQKSALGSETKQEFFVLGLPPPIASPTVWLEPDSYNNLLTIYFTAPADAGQNKFARYTVWKRDIEGRVTEVPIHAHSFLWSTPRLPSSQEYLSVHLDPLAQYKLELVDQYGVSTESDWQAVEVQ